METNTREKRGIEPELDRVLNLATRNLLTAQTAIDSGSLETAQTAIDSAREFMAQLTKKLTSNGHGSNGHAPREPEALLDVAAVPATALLALKTGRSAEALQALQEQLAPTPRESSKKIAPPGTYSNIIRGYLATHAGPFRAKDVVLWAQEKRQQVVEPRDLSASLSYLVRHKKVLRKKMGVFQRPKTT